MLIMPSANMRNNNATTGTVPQMKSADFNINVEELVLEIKQNLRVSTSMKALPCSHLSRKSSRASPYRVPARVCSCDSLCEPSSCAARKLKRKPANQDSSQEDPYELLQRLLRDGSLVNEAVRRVQLGLSPKQRYYYESDESDASPMLRLCSQKN